jgi:hypothetical protein
VHAFQYDIAAETGRRVGSGAGLERLPLWFIEGMAEYLSLGPIDSNTAMWVREAASRDAMPSIDKLDDPDFFPYRYGHAFWLRRRPLGRPASATCCARRPDGNFKAAISVLGVDDQQLDRVAQATKSFAAV